MPHAIDTSQNPAYLEWAGEKIGVRFNPNVSVTIAQVDEGKPVCVVVYNNVSAFDCCMHVAATVPDWASKAFLREAFKYPFETLKLRRVTFAAAASNEKSIKLQKLLGAKHEGTIRQFDEDGDMVIHGMLKEECRWIKGNHHG